MAPRLGRRGRGRWISGPLTLAVVAGALMLVLLLTPGPDTVTKAEAEPTAHAIVTVAADVSTVSVPRSFLGVSTEYWSLPLFDRHVVVFNRALSMLRVPGGGPLTIRIGGDSADQAVWDPRAASGGGPHGLATTPRWVNGLFAITPQWVNDAAALVHDFGARLILDLNLVTTSNAASLRWARAAEVRLPAGSIVGFEIGNEPDLYARRYWLHSLAAGRYVRLPRDASPRDYTHEFLLFARVLARIAPGVPVIGPAIANDRLDVGWISSLIAGAKHALSAVSAHLYPLTACKRPSSSWYPTIARVLGEKASAGLVTAVEPAVELAHRAGLPLRLTEFNSVTCGGLSGVSNTFATALWAPDALFELMRAGVASVDVHTRAQTINAPFAIRHGKLQARPLLYGLALFARTLGPDARLVAVKLDAERALGLKAWAVRSSGNRLRVLLIDKGDDPVRVTLRVVGTGPATVQYLRAPSVSSSSGVTFGGETIGPNGTWTGRPRAWPVARGVGGYSLRVPGYSAALVSMHVAGGSPPRS